MNKTNFLYFHNNIESNLAKYQAFLFGPGNNQPGSSHYPYTPKNIRLLIAHLLTLPALSKIIPKLSQEEFEKKYKARPLKKNSKSMHGKLVIAISNRSNSTPNYPKPDIFYLNYINNQMIAKLALSCSFQLLIALSFYSIAFHFSDLGGTFL